MQNHEKYQHDWTLVDQKVQDHFFRNDIKKYGSLNKAESFKKKKQIKKLYGYPPQN